MNVFCESKDHVTVAIIEGDICVPDSDKFREFILKRIESGTTSMLLDFTAVPYVDSSGISALLALLQAARKAGGDIRLAGINERITSVFRQIGLHHVFRKFPTREEGIRSFAPMNLPEPVKPIKK